jgi:uncharacterized protein
MILCLMAARVFIPFLTINMTEEAKHHLHEAARLQQVKTDPAHCFEHVKRVLAAGQKIGRAEGADEDIVYASILFHDAVMYRKGTPENKNSTEESALFAEKVLRKSEFPQEKVPAVLTCIRECSFSKGIKPSSLESAVVVDSDMLDACGALGIMRTFSYGGLTNRPLYTPHDPFCESSEAQKMRSGVDHFYDRLRLVLDRMNTNTGRELARRRTKFLDVFLEELKVELEELK